MGEPEEDAESEAAAEAAEAILGTLELGEVSGGVPQASPPAPRGTTPDLAELLVKSGQVTARKWKPRCGRGPQREGRWARS